MEKRGRLSPMRHVIGGGEPGLWVANSRGSQERSGPKFGEGGGRLTTI